MILKTDCCKLYKNFYIFLNFLNYWKNLLIDFITILPILTNSKAKNYDLIFFIINQLTKIPYYKFVKILINTIVFAKMIINILIQQKNILISIIIN